MNYQFWKKTGCIKPFQSVEEFEKFQEDAMNDKWTGVKPNSPFNKAIAKKGFAYGVSYDSFAEFTFMTYEEKICHASVERNMKLKFLNYIDENGKGRKWYPDFIVNGIFYEVKGVVRPKDQQKKNQHPEVEWVFSEDCKQMAKELDDKCPGWRDEFVPKN